MAPTQYRPSYDRSWALVVGIDEYPALPHVPPLRTAVAGARAVAALLKDEFAFDQAIVLENQAATRLGILRVLQRDIARRAGPDDRVVIYFAGHGLTRQTVGAVPRGYLVPADCAADPETGEMDWPTALEIADLTEECEHIRAKHVLFLLDACFSGLALTRAAPAESVAEDYLTHRAVQALTAGLADQTVADYHPGGHSPFTGFLLDGLRGQARMPGGLLRAHHLAGYMQDAVSQYTRLKQTPQYGYLPGSEGGDFIFRLPGPPKLPDEIAGLLKHSLPGARQGAVTELARLLLGRDTALAALARVELERLRDDDPDVAVRTTALIALGEAPAPPVSEKPPPVEVKLPPPSVGPAVEAEPPPTTRAETQPRPAPAKSPAVARAQPPVPRISWPRLPIGMIILIGVVGVLGLGIALALALPALFPSAGAPPSPERLADTQVGTPPPTVNIIPTSTSSPAVTLIPAGALSPTSTLDRTITPFRTVTPTALAATAERCRPGLSVEEIGLSGTGIFTWRLTNVEGGDPTAIANKATAAGFKFILINIANGPNTSGDAALNAAVVQALQSAGIKVWGWHYVIGNDPEAEAQIAIGQVQGLGLDGYVVVAESEYKQTGKDVAAVTFMQALTRGLELHEVPECSSHVSVGRVHVLRGCRHAASVLGAGT
ncbi:MAG: caspase family protein [Chloroflexi bacterium]|nr:caspase family protein [Chloroflexota bacterium]